MLKTLVRFEIKKKGECVGNLTVLYHKTNKEALTVLYSVVLLKKK